MGVSARVFVRIRVFISLYIKVSFYGSLYASSDLFKIVKIVKSPFFLNFLNRFLKHFLNIMLKTNYVKESIRLIFLRSASKIN